MKLLLLTALLVLSVCSFSQERITVEGIPAAIEEAEKGNFVSLSLYGDESEDFPQEFFSIPKEQLIGLVIDNCHYTSIPDEVSEYQNIFYFRYSWFLFGRSPLPNFPSFLTELTSLETLQIEGTNFSEIPSLTKLTKLHDLSLMKCGLTEFPNSVLDLSHLKELDLACNSFTSIPEGIDQLISLKRLNFNGGACGSTPIEFIPKSLGNLTKLEYLSFGDTEIEYWQFEDFYKSLPYSK